MSDLGGSQSTRPPRPAGTPGSLAFEAGFHRPIPVEGVAAPLLHVIAEKLRIKFGWLESDLVSTYPNIPQWRNSDIDDIKEGKRSRYRHLLLIVFECHVPKPILLHECEDH